MKYTSAHWGSYQFDSTAEELRPIDDDTDPSRIGRGWVSASQDKNSRIMRPAIRAGWLNGDKGTARCNDSFVEVSWERAITLAANAVQDVRETHGNGAIFGGSYGWSSAGRFHHAQSQMRRFLNLAGGYVGARNTYSHAAAEVLFPHILGLSNKAFQDQMTAMPLVAKNCDLLLAFGGISKRTSQITSSGTSKHEVGPWLDQMRNDGMKVINVSPRKSDMESSEWLAIRPGTDTALILALTYEIAHAGLADHKFLERYTSGWDQYSSYLCGETDKTAKTAEWAAEICGIKPEIIRTLAKELAQTKSMISVAWGLQRAEHGEQPIWAALALAAVLGQIGQPGTGFSFGYGSTTPVGRASKLISWPSFPQGRNPITDYIPVARVADMLLHPRETYKYNGETRTYPDIQLVWWTGGNPFHHHQDLIRLERAWQRPETVIVNDHSWTATARRADIVFPATTPLERNDIMMNRRDPTLLWMSKFHEPKGEAKNDFEIFSMLAAELGFQQEFTEGRDSDAWIEDIWRKSQDVAKTNGFELPNIDDFQKAGRFDVPDATEERIALYDFVQDPDQNPLATHSGRITLTNQTIAAMDLESCPAHPTWIAPTEGALGAQTVVFHLISGQPDTRLHSQNDRGVEAQADKIKQREAVYLHPDAAHALNVSAGEIVELYNERGSCLAGVRIDEGLRTDCVFLPTGAWYDPQIINGRLIEVHGNPNILTADKGCSALSQGNIAHSCTVKIRKWTAKLPELSVSKPPKFVPH